MVVSTFYLGSLLATAEHDGTIKDYAGDGVLVLIGAPLAREDHASAGVATGRVTVGAIGSSSRMEYTAVGTAVNLAARLCSAATDGEILASQRTVELAGADDVESRGSIQVKGLSAEQQIYAVLA